MRQLEHPVPNPTPLLGSVQKDGVACASPRAAPFVAYGPFFDLQMAVDLFQVLEHERIIESRYAMAGLATVERARHSGARMNK